MRVASITRQLWSEKHEQKFYKVNSNGFSDNRYIMKCAWCDNKRNQKTGNQTVNIWSYICRKCPNVQQDYRIWEIARGNKIIQFFFLQFFKFMRQLPQFWPSTHKARIVERGGCWRICILFASSGQILSPRKENKRLKQQNKINIIALWFLR